MNMPADKNALTKPNWERRLAGDTDVPMHDGEPDYGFYRIPKRDKSGWLPVSYWYVDDGTLRCRIDGREVHEQRAREQWPWAAPNAISHELYESVIAGGEWPDLHEAVTRSHNQPPPDDSLEALQQAIEDLEREAKKLITAGPAQSKEASDQAADVANRLGAFWSKADIARQAEKRPHLEAERAVDDKWRPLLTAAQIYKRLKDVVVTPFLQAEQAKKQRAEAEARRQAEEARRAAEAAEREAHRLAEEAARSGDVSDAAKALHDAAETAARNQAAAEAAERNATSIAATKITAGTRGRSIGLRGKTVVTIEDREAVLGFFKDREEITALLQTMAEKAVGAGITVPGVKVTKDSKAA